MGEPWSDIAALLRQQKLLAPQSLRQRLLSLDNPRDVIQSARSIFRWHVDFGHAGCAVLIDGHLFRQPCKWSHNLRMIWPERNEGT